MRCVTERAENADGSRGIRLDDDYTVVVSIGDVKSIIINNSDASVER